MTAVVLMLASCAGRGNGWIDAGPGSSAGPTVTITGTVRHLPIEGGVWVIQDAGGTSYNPTNLPDAVRQDGLAVEAEARRRDDMVSIGMVGALVELVRIRRRPGAAVSGAGADAGASVVAEGMVVFFERLALPPAAVVRVELRDTSRADAPAVTLAAQQFTARDGPPFRFQLRVPAASVDPRAELSVFADIRDGDRLMFITDTRHPVPREGATGMDIRLTFVASAPGGPAPGIVTPVPVAYRCGDETFRVAFEERRAYVTMPDGSLMALGRLDGGGDPEEPRRFSDGRLTFVQEIEGTGGPRVLFARGRAMPAPCARIE